jgi:Putative Actinobacterial Holin-X, holin superfamily III
VNNAEKSAAPLGELLGALVRDAGVLARQEVQIASTEMTVKARSVARSAALIGIGSALAHAGFLALWAAIAIALVPIVPLWLSTLVLGVVVSSVGYALIQKGLTALQKLNPVPEQTVQTMDSNLVWAKEHMR